MEKEVSIIKEAREVYRLHPKTPLTEYLKRAADEMDEAYGLLKVTPTRSHIRNFIGLSTAVMVALNLVNAPKDPTPSAGAGEVDKKAKVA
jgi:hypothetical protein